jgi:carbamate kinase
MEPVLSWVAVDPDDPGFADPSKPVGPQLSEEDAVELHRRHPEWRFAPYGQGLRRLVASPQPRRILNLDDICDVVADGKVPVALGGGGIPVLLDAQERMEIADGILDKDLSSALLAAKLESEVLLVLTNERGMFTGYGTTTERLHRRATTAEVATWLAAGEFPPGSMGPKAKAALRFLASRPGGKVVIGHVDEPAEKLVRAESGTTITTT